MNQLNTTPDSHLERIGKAVVNAAYRVHKELGPGLLEKVYEACFCYEIKKSGFRVRRQIDIPIFYDNLVFDEGLRLDVLIHDEVICELKAVDLVNPVWEAQIISHLKLSKTCLIYTCHKGSKAQRFDFTVLNLSVFVS